MCDNCEEELITTSQGPQGEQGEQGEPGTNGTDGILDWSEFDLSCWLAQGIIEVEDNNDEITQNFIDVFCEMYQSINTAPVAVNDYRTMNQDSIIYIEVINNDNYYPDVTVTIALAPSNGTATIESDNKTIKYIPDEGFIGVDDFDYTINDGTATSTATVSVTVEEVISQQTIQDTVLEQLQILLASDEYWDLGFNIGDKIGISNINLDSFDFTNPFTAGIGKPGRYSKWAICNGNNGAEDLTVGTFRGFDHTNSDYDESAKAGGNDTLTLSRDNIPPHKHVIGLTSVNDTGTAQSISDLQGKIAADSKDITNLEAGNRISRSWSGAGSDFGDSVVWANSGDGSNNNSNEDELQATPDAVNIRNAFKTVILIQKIA